jgi:hypothetical protein
MLHCALNIAGSQYCHCLGDPGNVFAIILLRCAHAAAVRVLCCSPSSPRVTLAYTTWPHSLNLSLRSCQLHRGAAIGTHGRRARSACTKSNTKNANQTETFGPSANSNECSCRKPEQQVAIASVCTWSSRPGWTRSTSCRSSSFHHHHRSVPQRPLFLPLLQTRPAADNNSSTVPPQLICPPAPTNNQVHRKQVHRAAIGRSWHTAVLCLKLSSQTSVTAMWCVLCSRRGCTVLRA